MFSLSSPRRCAPPRGSGFHWVRIHSFRPSDSSTANLVLSAHIPFSVINPEPGTKRKKNAHGRSVSNHGHRTAAPLLHCDRRQCS